jgi:peptidoglycan/LPS O-acetylase OafA/YrhL
MPSGEHHVVTLGGRERIDPLGQRRSLDGLRAVAVGAVLVYHARFDWAAGGFLGVTTFFTLSGFLITSLLLREWSAHRSIDLRGFWSRRFRRLLPAAWATLGLVLVMGAAGIWNDDQLRALRSDVPYALAQVLNWHFVAQGRGYGTDFVAPSPIEHFWSLAIEEQFYLVLPVLLVGLLLAGTRTVRWEGGGGVRRLSLWPAVAALGAMAAASAAFNWWSAGGEVFRAYYGTFSRAAELLVGSLLACALLRRGTVAPQPVRRALVAVGVAGLACSVWLWHVATVATAWTYPWGLLLAATATVAMIVGALQPGAWSAALSWGPLVALGRISYGVYLLHWPVFLWLSPARVPWPQWPLFALRVSVSVAGAAAMFRLLERPVRRRALLRGWRTPALAGTSVLALVVGVGVLTADLPAPSSLQLLAQGRTQGERVMSVQPPPPPLRVLLLGDQLAQSADGLLDVGGSRPVQVTVAGVADCGLAVGGWVRLTDGRVERDADRCGPIRDLWSARVAAERPDVVLVWSGLRDVTDRRFAAVEPWRAPGDPVLDQFLRTEVGSVLDAAAGTGAQVGVLTTPHLRDDLPPPGPTPRNLPPEASRRAAIEQEDRVLAVGVPPPGHPENDDARIDAWNRAVTQAAAVRGVTVFDVAAHMRGWPGGEFAPTMRSGGLGLGPAGARDVADWLAPQLRDLTARPAVPAAAAPSGALADVAVPPPPPAGPRRHVPAGRAATVLVAGESVGYNYMVGLGLHTRVDRGLRPVNATELGCPVVRGGDRRFLLDVAPFGPNCDWSRTLPKLVATQRPDVVMVSSGVWEVVDRRFPGDERWRHIGQPEVDAYIVRELVALIDVAGAGGATVVLTTSPHMAVGLDQGYSDLPESRPERVDRLNELIHRAAALRPGVAAVLDVQSWLAAQPGSELDPAKRDDGLHFTDAYLRTVASWMAPQLERIARG